jgi:hypothetical protein
MPKKPTAATARSSSARPSGCGEILGSSLAHLDTRRSSQAQALSPTILELNRQQKLADRIDRVSQADRAFFKRRPDRVHRVRLASSAEIQQEELLSGFALTVPENCRIFTIVWQIASGVRLRVLVCGDEGAETDISEREARLAFESTATKRVWEIEATLHEAFAVSS